MAIKKDDASAMIDESTDKAVKKIESAVQESEEGTVTVQLSDDDDDDDAPEPKDAAARESRNERRRNRYREAQEDAAAARRESDELRRQTAEINAKLGQAMGYIDSLRQQPAQSQGQPQRDQDEEALSKVYDEQEQIYNLITLKGKNISADELAKFNKRARELDAQKTRLITQQAVRGQQAQQSQQAQPNIQELAMQAALRMNHSDVYGHAKAQQATAYADRVYLELSAHSPPKNEHEANELLNRAMDAARVKILGTQARFSAPAPSAGQRAKYSGEGSGAGAGRNSGPPRQIEMTKQAKEMASAMYPKLSEKERYEKWAKGPGLRALEKKA